MDENLRPAFFAIGENEQNNENEMANDTIAEMANELVAAVTNSIEDSNAIISQDLTNDENVNVAAAAAVATTNTNISDSEDNRPFANNPSVLESILLQSEDDEEDDDDDSDIARISPRNNARRYRHIYFLSPTPNSSENDSEEETPNSSGSASNVENTGAANTGNDTGDMTNTEMSSSFSSSTSSSEAPLASPMSSPSQAPSIVDELSDSSIDSDMDIQGLINYDDENMEIEEKLSPIANYKISKLLNNKKPTPTWNVVDALMKREHGFQPGFNQMRNFSSQFYSSPYAVERLKLSHCLTKHHGCVNSLNFSRDGDVLCSGSDDRRIIIWDWAQNKPKQIYKTGHVTNIFQTKFLNSTGCYDIVSSSRSGDIYRTIIPSNGGKSYSTSVMRHSGAVHKIVTIPDSSYEIISVGEDGYIKHKDLRTENDPTICVRVSNNRQDWKVRLYSVAHHPTKPEICVSGTDRYVRVYDKRNFSKTVFKMCPTELRKNFGCMITCCIYDHTGDEILASYADKSIYLFDAKNYKRGEFLHSYLGHYNHRTIKGVNFFGPNSDYVVSGSDCGHIFIWSKETEAIINFFTGDVCGVVNCLEPHPTVPILATSGLDHNVKIWTPDNDKYPPNLEDLEHCVKQNFLRSATDEENAFDNRQFDSFISEFLERNGDMLDNVDDDDDTTSNGSNSFSDSSTDDDSIPIPPESPRANFESSSQPEPSDDINLSSSSSTSISAGAGAPASPSTSASA